MAALGQVLHPHGASGHDADGWPVRSHVLSTRHFDASKYRAGSHGWNVVVSESRHVDGKARPFRTCSHARHPEVQHELPQADAPNLISAEALARVKADPPRYAALDPRPPLPRNWHLSERRRGVATSAIADQARGHGLSTEKASSTLFEPPPRMPRYPEIK